MNSMHIVVSIGIYMFDFQVDHVAEVSVFDHVVFGMTFPGHHLSNQESMCLKVELSLVYFYHIVSELHACIAVFMLGVFMFAFLAYVNVSAEHCKRLCKFEYHFSNTESLQGAGM